MGYIDIIFGVYLVILAFLMKSENFISKIVFNVIIFTIGMYLIVLGVDCLGFITLNF